MASRAQSAAARRRTTPNRGGLRLVVYHASPDVQPHIAQLKRSRKFKVSCYSQRTVPIRPPATSVDAVLWEIAPGRRPNWRQLKAIARGTAVVSYSAAESADVIERSRGLGFACHLNAPLSPVEVEHQVALALPVDLATRFRQFQPALRRHLTRVEAVGEMMRAANASLEPQRVADALVARAAAWLPAPCWVVVGPDPGWVTEADGRARPRRERRDGGARPWRLGLAPLAGVQLGQLTRRSLDSGRARGGGRGIPADVPGAARWPR